MAKIVLGNRPESFKRALKFPMVDGTEGTMEVIYKYRTLTEFGTMFDEWVAEKKTELDVEKAKQEADREKALEAGKEYAEPQLSNEQSRRLQAQSNADYIMRIVVGWNLDMEFSAEAVLQLCDELPAGANEIMNAYRAAIAEGRLGN
jgi:Phage tail assembly chaperone